MNIPSRRFGFVSIVLVLWAAFVGGCATGGGTHAGGEGNFNVRDFGARGDGSADATHAIAAAINAARQAGGGTVRIPAGSYTTGPIQLVDNLVLQIDAGATLHFPAQRLPYTKGRIQGIECLTPIPLIGGENLQNVTITGRGTITTDNADWVKLMGPPEARTATNPGSAFGPEWNHLRALLQEQTPQPQAEYLKVAPHLRPAFIRLTDSTHVRIDGIRIVGSPLWTIHILYCQDVLVDGVTQETFPGIFTGGIYIDSSRDVRISNCNLDNGDDAIVLKAGKDADGLRVNRPTENVAVTNCIVHRGSGAIVIGSETSGWIRNVVVSNIVCRGTQMGINIKTERGRGGGVENVRIENITMDQVGRPITVTQFYQMQGETPAGLEVVSARTPVFRNITIQHVTITRSPGIIDFSWNPISTTSSSGEGPQPVLVDIAGLPEMPIYNLRLSDVIISGKGNMQASNTLGMELHDVTLDTEGGAPYIIRDSQGLELDDVGTHTPHVNAPVVRLERCPGAVLRNTRSVEGAAVAE